MQERRFDETRIQALREFLGISQDEFAQRLGTTRQHVHAWESGKHHPNVATLIRIVNVFGASLESFFVATTTKKAG